MGIPISFSLMDFERFFLWLEITFRASRSQIFFKTSVLKKLAAFTWKHQCWNKFVKKRPQHRYFLLRTTPVVVPGHLHYFLFLLYFPLSHLSFCFMFTKSYRHVFFLSVLIFLVRMVTNIQKKKCSINKKHVFLAKLKEECR